MTSLFTLAALLAVAGPGPAPAQSFRLEPGDFRWIPFTVKQTPTGVDCRFDVVEGGATVHAELLPMSEFRRFDRGLAHDTLALTTPARSAEFRRVIDTRGQYAVVIANDRKAPAVTVSLHLETNANPNPDTAKTLSPERRLTVILLSFAFFLVTVSWSSRKLILAMRKGHE